MRKNFFFFSVIIYYFFGLLFIGPLNHEKRLNYSTNRVFREKIKNQLKIHDLHFFYYFVLIFLILLKKTNGVIVDFIYYL